MIISIGKTKQLGEYINIASNGHNLKIFPKAIDPKAFVKTEDIVILTNTMNHSNHLEGNGGMVVSSPGEFEKSGIFVFAQKNATHDKANINFVEVDAENVRVLYYASNSELDRDLLNQIGVIHVLVVEVKKDFANLIKAISTIDPQILIPLFNEGVDVEKFKSELGIKFDQEKKFKCSASDFLNEEYVLHGVLL